MPTFNEGQKRKAICPLYEPEKRTKASHELEDGSKNSIDRFENASVYRAPSRAQRAGWLHGVPGTPKEPNFLFDLNRPRNTFKYTALTVSEEIRLLCLYAGNDDDHIDIGIKPFNLNCMPEFEALSYVWGTEPAICDIALNGLTIAIQTSLTCALKTLRRPDRSQFLWVDAICINQIDNIEKSSQVQKMGEIYNRAKNVLIWTGEIDEDAGKALDFIPTLQDPELFRDKEWPSIYASGFYSLARFIERPWFQRVWTLQEAVLARNPILMCGARETHLRDLTDSADMIRSRLEPIKKCLRSTPLYDQHGHLLDRFENSSFARLSDLMRHAFTRDSAGTVVTKRLSLEHLVCDLTPFQATDPRDTIFALLGLARQSDMPPLDVSYCKSVLDVYAQFIAGCQRTSGSLDIILRPWAPRKKTPWQDALVDPDLRFRVPSWIRVRADLPFGDPRDERVHADGLVGMPARRVYDASQGVGAQVRFGIDGVTRTADGSMFAKGVVLGAITRLSTRMADGLILQEAVALIGGVTRDGSGKLVALDDVLWRVLCADRDEKGDPPLSTYRIAAMHLLQEADAACSIDTKGMLEGEGGQPEYKEAFLRRAQAVTWNRRVFRAPDEMLGKGDKEGEEICGLAPRDTRHGDYVCIIFGVSVPVVLRKHSRVSGYCWEILGEAYVDGAMDGEKLSGVTKQELDDRTQDFEIW